MYFANSVKNNPVFSSRFEYDNELEAKHNITILKDAILIVK